MPSPSSAKSSLESSPKPPSDPVAPSSTNLFSTLRTLYSKYGEIIRYLIIGVLTTIISLITYYSLVFTILDPADPFELQLANVISWIISVLFAYFTNRSYVFQVKDRHATSEFFKFIASRLFTLLVDMAIMFIFVTLLSLDDKLIKIFSQVVVIVLNYLLSKFLVFIKPKSDTDNRPSPNDNPSAPTPSL